MISCLGYIHGTVLAIEQVLLIQVLQPLLIVYFFAHEMKCVIFIIQVGSVLGEHGDTAHIDRQTKKSSLKQQIHVAIDSCVRAPVIHFQFLDQRQEGLFEYLIILGAHEHFSFINLLDV